MAVQKFNALKPYLYENDFNILDKKTISGLINALISPSYNSKDEINIVFRFLDRDLKTNFEKTYQK